MNIIEPAIWDPVPTATHDLLAGPVRLKTKSEELAGMRTAKVRFDKVPSTAFCIKVEV